MELTGRRGVGRRHGRSTNGRLAMVLSVRPTLPTISSKKNGNEGGVGELQCGWRRGLSSTLYTKLEDTLLHCPARRRTVTSKISTRAAGGHSNLNRLAQQQQQQHARPPTSGGQQRDDDDVQLEWYAIRMTESPSNNERHARSKGERYCKLVIDRVAYVCIAAVAP